MSLYQKEFDTKAGKMVGICDETHLLLLHFNDKYSLEKETEKIKQTLNEDISSENHEILDKLEQGLSLYFDGKLSEFSVPINFNIGTPFQQKVWNALCDIPYGETISYKQLAENINQPTAFRAVANANGKNQLSIIVPCHRVIAADGSLGGYSSGVDRKEKLLAIESGLNV